MNLPKLQRRAARLPDTSRLQSLAVVGLSSGRAGTAYCSALLRKNGFSIGHEEIFTPKGISPKRLQGDISWLATPLIGMLQMPLFAISRDPADIINSFVSLGFFKQSYSTPYKRFASQYFPFTGNQGADAINWCMFHLEKAIKNSEFHFRVGLDRPNLLLDYMEQKVPKHSSFAPSGWDLDVNIRNKKSENKTYDAEVYYPEQFRDQLVEFSEWAGYSSEPVRRMFRS